MKVLTARILVWLLDKVATRLLNWIADLEGWAGVGFDADEYKAGGTD